LGQGVPCRAHRGHVGKRGAGGHRRARGDVPRRPHRIERFRGANSRAGEVDGGPRRAAVGRAHQRAVVARRVERRARHADGVNRLDAASAAMHPRRCRRGGGRRTAARHLKPELRHRSLAVGEVEVREYDVGRAPVGGDVAVATAVFGRQRLQGRVGLLGFRAAVEHERGGELRRVRRHAGNRRCGFRPFGRIARVVHQLAVHPDPEDSPNGALADPDGERARVGVGDGDLAAALADPILVLLLDQRPALHDVAAGHERAVADGPHRAFGDGDPLRVGEARAFDLGRIDVAADGRADHPADLRRAEEIPDRSADDAADSATGHSAAPKDGTRRRRGAARDRQRRVRPRAASFRRAHGSMSGLLGCWRVGRRGRGVGATA
jgi:hypothetical protein